MKSWYTSEAEGTPGVNTLNTQFVGSFFARYPFSLKAFFAQ